MNCFNKELEMICKDIEYVEKILPYGNLLWNKDQRFRSIALHLQKNQTPIRWFSTHSSTSKSLSIIQLIHRSSFFLFSFPFSIDFLVETRHRFNEYYSWIKSLKDVQQVDSHCIHRTSNLIELMCLAEAIQLNTTIDQVGFLRVCFSGWKNLI